MIKISRGQFKNQILLTPKEIRPTSEKLRQAVFNICQSYITEARFLDLFAGSGAMGIEALSQGAKHATFVDNDISSIQCIQKNLTKLNLLSSSTVMTGEALIILEKLIKKGETYDLIYIDPPYTQKDKSSLQAATLLCIDSSPLLAKEGLLFLEDRHSKEDPFSSLPLQNLSLVSKRKYGSSSLYQFSTQLPQK